MVTEPWSATAVSTVSPQQQFVHFVGRFPGFQASKRQVNLLTRPAVPAPRLMQSTPAVAMAAPQTAGLVFEGPSESDTPYIPPNPNVAAGPDYIVVVINSLMAIYDKTGAQQGGLQ